MTDPTNRENSKTRPMAWPGGARALARPSEPQDERPVSPDYFAGSDLAENDPNWTGLWPSEADPEIRGRSSLTDSIREGRTEAPYSQPDVRPDENEFDAPAWPPAIEDPQLPPRAWPPDQFGAQAAFVPEKYEPEDAGENIRRSGLAWSAGIVFFSSVAFMLFLGWIADLLFGSSPFGIVAGVVLGSAIGFIQFFRISKQIFEPSNKRSEIRSLMSDPGDDDDTAGF